MRISYLSSDVCSSDLRENQCRQRQQYGDSAEEPKRLLHAAQRKDGAQYSPAITESIKLAYRSFRPGRIGRDAFTHRHSHVHPMAAPFRFALQPGSSYREDLPDTAGQATKHKKN